MDVVRIVDACVVLELVLLFNSGESLNRWLSLCHVHSTIASFERRIDNDRLLDVISAVVIVPS